MVEVIGCGESVQQTVGATLCPERLSDGATCVRDFIGHRGPQHLAGRADCVQGDTATTGAVVMIAITRLAADLAKHVMPPQSSLRPLSMVSDSNHRSIDM